MKMSSSTATQISVSAREAGRPGTRAYERAVFAVSVTGEASANVLSQSGMLCTGTNTDDANTSGKITTKPTDCAASDPRTISATKAKSQHSATPNAHTTRIAATAGAMPP